MSKKPTERQARTAFRTLSRVNPFVLGDKVRVLRRFEDWELGSDTEFYIDMEQFVGTEMEVTDVYDDGSYELNHNYAWPFFVLEKTGESLSIEIGGYTGIISDDGMSVEVGCQTIDFEVVTELAEKMRRQQALAPRAKAPKRRSR